MKLLATALQDIIIESIRRRCFLQYFIPHALVLLLARCLFLMSLPYQKAAACRSLLRTWACCCSRGATIAAAHLASSSWCIWRRPLVWRCAASRGDEEKTKTKRLRGGVGRKAGGLRSGCWRTVRRSGEEEEEDSRLHGGGGEQEERRGGGRGERSCAPAGRQAKGEEAAAEEARTRTGPAPERGFEELLLRQNECFPQPANCRGLLASAACWLHTGCIWSWWCASALVRMHENRFEERRAWLKSCCNFMFMF